MGIDEAYRKHSLQMVRYARKIGSLDAENIVHSAFLDAVQVVNPIRDWEKWLKVAIRRKHWKDLRHEFDHDVPERLENSGQHESALIGQIDKFIDSFGAEGKSVFVDRVTGCGNAEIAERVGLTPQGVSDRFLKMKRKMEKHFLSDGDSDVIKKARELCALSHDWGDVLRRGILGGQCDNGTLVQDFVPEAKRILGYVQQPE